MSKVIDERNRLLKEQIKAFKTITDKREAIASKKPELLEKPDITELLKEMQSFVDSANRPDYNVNYSREKIFVAAINAFYGTDIWEWMRVVRA